MKKVEFIGLFYICYWYYTQRQELQNSFYPQGITYNRQKDECGSIEVNEFLEEVSDLSEAFATFNREQIKNLDFTSLSACRAKSRHIMLLDSARSDIFN